MKLREVMDATIDDIEFIDGTLFYPPARPRFAAQLVTTQTGRLVHVTRPETLHTYCGRIGWAVADARSGFVTELACPTCARAARRSLVGE